MEKNTGQNNALTLINPSTLYNATQYGYSHGAVIQPGKRLIYLAGQGAENEKGEHPETDFRKQVQITFANLEKALQAAEASFDDVAKVTVLVVDHDMGKLEILVEEWRKIWPAGNFPANTLIPVPRLAIDGMLVEIDAVAVR